MTPDSEETKVAEGKRKGELESVASCRELSE
jgi:hypothetical protein